MDRLLMRRRFALVGVLATGAALIAAPVSAADSGHGRAVFSQQCSMCHTSSRGGGALLGPSLFGVVGREAGSVAGYNYSAAMKGAGFVWSDDKLHTYLTAPAKMLPGIKMPFMGVKNPGQLDDLVAYLETLK